MTFAYTWSNFSFMLPMLLGAGLYSRFRSRRSHFMLRLILCVAVCIGVAVAVPEAEQSQTFHFVFNYPFHLFLFFLVLASHRICLATDIRTAVFDCLFGLVVLNLCNTASSIIGFIFQLSTESMANTAVRVASYACGLLFAFFESGHRHKAGPTYRNRTRRIFIYIILCVLLAMFAMTGLIFQPILFMNSIFISVCMLLFFGCGYLLLCVLVSEDNLNSENAVLKQIIEKAGQQYAMSRENINAINIKLHDFKHQIHALGEGGLHVDPTVLQDLENKIGIYDAVVKTGNEPLDIVLTEKSVYCAQNKIETTCFVDGSSMRFIAEADVYSLFGNILDNAIEAVEKLPEEKRVIGISVVQQAGIIRICAENYYNGCVNLADGEIVTSKLNAAQHGFGLKSIALVAEKYGGVVKVKFGKEVFTINIILPFPAEEAA